MIELSSRPVSPDVGHKPLSWEHKVCVRCKALFTGKKHDDCGSEHCSDPSGQFREFKPPMRNAPQLERIIGAFATFFDDDASIHSAGPLPIRPPVVGNSLFTSSGSNINNEIIFGKSNSPAYDSTVAVAQPVVRLKSSPSSDRGFLRSFINLTLVRTNASREEHDVSQERMFDWLSSSGLYVPDLTLLKSNQLEDWGLGPFVCENTKLMYRGLELGVSNYSAELPISNGMIRYSDVSVGAERVNWAIHKTEQITPTILPQQYKTTEDFGVIDSHRTVVLGALSQGCSPTDSTPQGAKMRQISQELAGPGVPVDYELVQIYSNFWKKYISTREPGKSPTAIYNEMNSVINRIGGA